MDKQITAALPTSTIVSVAEKKGSASESSWLFSGVGTGLVTGLVAGGLVTGFATGVKGVGFGVGFGVGCGVLVVGCGVGVDPFGFNWMITHPPRRAPNVVSLKLFES